MKALTKLFGNWKPEKVAHIGQDNSQSCCADRSIDNDIERDRLRKSTIHTSTCKHQIKSIKGFLKGNKVYAKVKKAGLSDKCELMYALGTKPKTADLVPWQTLPKGERETPAFKVPTWNRGIRHPVFFTVHAISKKGKIGPPVHVQIDERSPQGNGGDGNQVEVRNNAHREMQRNAVSAGPLGAAVATRPAIAVAAVPGISPLITAQHRIGIFSAYVEFESRDPNAVNYVYSIGSAPGESDLRWWQSLRHYDRRTGWHSMKELSLNPLEPFYFNVRAAYAAGSGNGEITSSAAMYFQWENLGAGNIVYDFPVDGYDLDGNSGVGWTPEEINALRYFTERMDPIIREIYGNPAHDMTLSIVKDAAYTGTNVFLAGINEIRTGLFGNWQLLTHEIVHAFHGHVYFTNDQNWKFDKELMGFEEGFAHAVSYLCMNIFSRTYPDDVVLGDLGDFYQPYTLADYEFRNHPNLITEDFWSAGAGMGLGFERYEMAASVFYKFFIENTEFFTAVNAAYYELLNDDVLHQLTPTREMMIDLISKVQGQIENTDTAVWIDRQHILACRNEIGDKVRLLSYLYTYATEFCYKNSIYHYQTFPDGNDWTYKYGTADEQLHSYNDRVGFYWLKRVRDGVTIASGVFTPTPSINPPASQQLARAEVHMSTAGDNSVYMSEIGDHVVKLNLQEELELYEMEVIHDRSAATHKKFYRLFGTALIEPEYTLCGAFLNLPTGGQLALVYEPDAEGNSVFPVVHAVVNLNTWLADLSSWFLSFDAGDDDHDKFPMGKVRIEYLSGDMQKYVAVRNLGFGDQNYGLNCILIDFLEMERIEQVV